MAYKDTQYVLKRLFEKTEKKDSEELIFVKARLKYDNTSYDSKNGHESVCFWEGTLACIKSETLTFEEDYGYTTQKDSVLAMAIEEGEELSVPSMFGKSYRIWLNNDSVDEIEFIKSTPELLRQYKEAYENIRYSVNLCDFEYGVHDDILVEGTEVSYDIPDAKTLDEADQWVMKNHPAQYLGCSITSNISDFYCCAIPSYYGFGSEHDYTTRQGREALTREYAKSHGLEVGEFTYDLLDKVIEERESKAKEEELER